MVKEEAQDEDDDDDYKSAVVASFQIAEEDQLTELVLWPHLPQVIHDTVMEAAEPDEEEHEALPPGMYGLNWEWTSTIPTTPQSEKMPHHHCAPPGRRHHQWQIGHDHSQTSPTSPAMHNIRRRPDVL